MQIRILANPFVDSRIPDNAIQANFETSTVEDMTIVRHGCAGERQYYYETLNELRR